jgi:enamine deaminase RidA (YjgF/YER057c/UK114 family)
MKSVFNLPTSSGLPYSEAVRAGDLIFASGRLATDYRSGIAAKAAVDPRRPYAGPPAINRQTQFIFEHLEQLLNMAGSSLDELVRVEQFIKYRADAPGFVETRRKFLNIMPPTSSLLVARELELPEARVLVNGIAVASGSSWKKEDFQTDKVPINQRGGYSLAQRAGPLVFLPGNTASDFQTGIHPEARVDHTFWFESDIVKQTEFILKTRRIVLEEMGLSLNDVVHATVYLTRVADLPEFEANWRKHFSAEGPAVTIVPVAELAVVGSVVEISVIALDPSTGEKWRIINTEDASQPLFRAPQAVKAGPYLFFSGLTASDANGLAEEATVDKMAPYYKSAIKIQARYIFRNVSAICAAAGLSIDDLVACQTILADLNDFFSYLEVWGEAFSVSPPANTVVGVPSPLAIPGCRIQQSWVAYDAS